jgi:hypothetical protein
MDSRNDRLVQIQQMSRSANERLQALAVAIVAAEQLIPFLCECADAADRGVEALRGLRDRSSALVAARGPNREIDDEGRALALLGADREPAFHSANELPADV